MKKGCIACPFPLWMLPWLLFSLLDFSFDEYCPIFGGKASPWGLRSCSFISRTVAKIRARIRNKGLAFQSFLFICPSNLSRSVTIVSRFNCKVHLSMSPLWPLPRSHYGFDYHKKERPLSRKWTLVQQTDFSKYSKPPYLTKDSKNSPIHLPTSSIIQTSYTLYSQSSHLWEKTLLYQIHALQSTNIPVDFLSQSDLLC